MGSKKKVNNWPMSDRGISFEVIHAKLLFATMNIEPSLMFGDLNGAENLLVPQSMPSGTWSRLINFHLLALI